MHISDLTSLVLFISEQEPILYIVRKQQRHSPTQVTPISDYYIVAGIVYQAPDLGSVVNSRLLSTVTHLQSAFEEAGKQKAGRASRRRIQAAAAAQIKS